MTSIITHEIEERYPYPDNGGAEGVRGRGDEESHGS